MAENDINMAEFRMLLKQRRDELSNQLSVDHVDVELDQSRVGRLSRMDAMQLHAMSSEIRRRCATEIQRIDAALKRLDEGVYGYCLRCGEEIALGRLRIDPSAALCVDCASAVEQSNAGHE